MPQAPFSSDDNMLQPATSNARCSLFSRLLLMLPQSIYLRFLLATLVVGLLTSAVAIFASWWIGREMVHTLRDENMVTVLQNSVELIGRTRIAMDEMRALAIDEKKRSADDSLRFASRLLDSFDERIGSGEMHPDEARLAAYRQLQNMTPLLLDPKIVLVTEEGRIRVHPDSKYVGRQSAEIQDAYGVPFFGDQETLNASGSSPSSHFRVVQQYRENKKKIPLLIADLYYAAWGVRIYAMTSLDGIEDELHGHFQTALNELRARVQEIVIAKTGYVFVFDESCHMIAHPSLIGEDLVSDGASSEESLVICQKLKKTAERPFGQNVISYQWERPDKRTSLLYAKLAWCVREPITGWYIVVSAYVKEVQSLLPRLIASISMPALGSIVLLGVALALLLRALLRPIADLTRLCQSVSRGDLETKVNEDAPGEMGYLCRQFNKMVFRLRVLRNKDEVKRQELESLNANLGKLVRVRTQALERKAKKLQSVNQRLRALDEMKSSFVSSVSHELRTPLTSILGFAKIILRDFRREYIDQSKEHSLSKRGGRIAANLKIIIMEGERLARLVNDFLDLAKIESGRMQWHDTVVDMSEVIERSVSTIIALAEQRNISVRVDIHDSLPSVFIDKDKVMQIFLNLLHNAVKFTPRGSICINVRADGNWIQCVVQDTGVGMSKHNLLRIFEKFQQVLEEDNTLTEKPKGTGLGLTICKNIIDHYGGLIWAESEPDKCTAVYIELPAMHDRVVSNEPIFVPESKDRPQ